MQKIGKYIITKVIGRGGLCTVFQARDPIIRRDVAIKTMNPSFLAGKQRAQAMRLLQNEAIAAAKCQHPNILTIYEYGEHKTAPYIVMELIRGVSLKKAMRENLPLKGAVLIVQQILTGLQYAHDANIVHRDIKPDNIILLKGRIVKIADFGIATLCASLVSNVVSGTPTYMAPEQIRGEKVDYKSDLFSAGMILFELLAITMCGSQKALRAHLLRDSFNLAPRILSKCVPPSFVKVIYKAMHPNPDMRYASAELFLLDILTAFKRHAEDNTEPQSQDLNIDTGNNSKAIFVWDKFVVQAIADILNKYIGSHSFAIIDNISRQYFSIGKLMGHISRFVPNRDDRENVVSLLTSKYRDTSPQVVFSSPHEDAHDWIMRSVTHTTMEASNKQHNLSLDVIASAEQTLTYYLGASSARVAIMQAKTDTVTNGEFFLSIAKAIPDKNKRAEYFTKYSLL